MRVSKLWKKVIFRWTIPLIKPPSFDWLVNIDVYSKVAMSSDKILFVSISLMFYIYKNVISIFCCSVSRIYQFTFPNSHFAINCNNPVRILFAQGVWKQPVLHTQRSDLIIQSVWNDMKKQNWSRLNPEELWQRLQDASRGSYRRCHSCHSNDTH